VTHTEFFCGKSVRVDTLYFRQGVEGLVEFLSHVLVGVDTEFVMVGGLVFPLQVRLDGQQSHEGINFVGVIAIAELLLS